MQLLEPIFTQQKYNRKRRPQRYLAQARGTASNVNFTRDQRQTQGFHVFIHLTAQCSTFLPPSPAPEHKVDLWQAGFEHEKCNGKNAKRKKNKPEHEKCNGKCAKHKKFH